MSCTCFGPLLDLVTEAISNELALHRPPHAFSPKKLGVDERLDMKKRTAFGRKKVRGENAQTNNVFPLKKNFAALLSSPSFFLYHLSSHITNAPPKSTLKQTHGPHAAAPTYYYYYTTIISFFSPLLQSPVFPPNILQFMCFHLNFAESSRRSLCAFPFAVMVPEKNGMCVYEFHTYNT